MTVATTTLGSKFRCLLEFDICVHFQSVPREDRKDRAGESHVWRTHSLASKADFIYTAVSCNCRIMEIMEYIHQNVS